MPPRKVFPVIPNRHRPLALPGRSIPVLVGGAMALALLAGCTSTPVDAPTTQAPTPPAVAVLEVGEGDQDAGVEVDLEGPIQVNFREITLPSGMGTGEHCHYGNLIAVVKAGTFTHYAPIYPDGVQEYHAGDSIFEGAGYLHEGRNEGTEDVVLLVTYLTPEGKPLAETDASHCEAP